MGRDQPSATPTSTASSHAAGVTAAREDLSVRAVGVATTIPDDPYAHLMYYLNIVETMCQFGIVPRIREHQRYYQMTADDRKAILAMSILFSPDEILGKLLFVVPDGSQILNGSANEIYEVSRARTFLHVDESIVIGGRSLRVVKIVVCTQGWLRNNWLGPMESLERRGDIAQLVGQTAPKPRGDPTAYQRLEEPQQKNNCGKILLWLWFWLSFSLPIAVLTEDTVAYAGPYEDPVFVFGFEEIRSCGYSSCEKISYPGSLGDKLDDMRNLCIAACVFLCGSLIFMRFQTTFVPFKKILIAGACLGWVLSCAALSHYQVEIKPDIKALALDDLDTQGDSVLSLIAVLVTVPLCAMVLFRVEARE